jgi:cytochrome c oxidase cbb3-type subunit 2
MASCRKWLPLALVAALGCGGAEVSDEAADDDFGGPAEVDWSDASVADGERLFGAVCSGCHGVRGDGKSRVAAAMFPAPRDLTRGEYRFRSTASGRLPRREDVLRTLEKGLPGTAMPAWKSRFAPRQLRSLVRYLETLSPRFADESRRDEDVIADASVLMPAPATPGVLARGRQVYSRMKCGQCHGPDGRGDGGAAETHRNSDGTPSHVFDFTWGVYKGGIEPADVYRTLMTGLDGTPMPSYVQSLPDESDRWALVHYVRSLSRPRGLWFYLREPAGWRSVSP